MKYQTYVSIVTLYQNTRENTPVIMYGKKVYLKEKPVLKF